MIERISELAVNRARRVLLVAGAVFLLAAAFGAPVISILKTAPSVRSAEGETKAAETDPWQRIQSRAQVVFIDVAREGVDGASTFLQTASKGNASRFNPSSILLQQTRRCK